MVGRCSFPTLQSFASLWWDSAIQDAVRMAITALIDAAFGLPVVEVPVVAESPFLEIHLVAVVGRGP